jgi:hypothetical protein
MATHACLLYITDQFQKTENAFRESKMTRAEYEQRMEVLQLKPFSINVAGAAVRANLRR